MDILISFIHQGLSAVVPFVVLLGLLVFVHEFGHFGVAKLCGVRVEVFSLGFGKKLFSFKRGDTTYCLSLIPLGGYVKMFGDEQGAQIEESQKSKSFLHKPVSQRIAVVLAGPLMNFFFAILIFFVVFLIGEEVRSPKLGDIEKGSEAFVAGFRSGDSLMEVDGQPVKSWDEFQKIINSTSSQKLSFTVKREGVDHVEKLEASPRWVPNTNPLSLDELVGDIGGLTYLSKNATVGILENSMVSQLGLMTGDRITSVNGRKVSFFRELETFLLPYQNQAIEFQIERDLSAEKKQTFTFKGQLGSFASIQGIGLESAELYLDKIQPDSSAEKAGLKARDRIVKVNNVVPLVWEDVLSNVKSFSGNGVVEIDVMRSGTVHHFKIVPKMTSFMTAQGSEEKRYTIGIVPMIGISPPETLILKSEGLFSSLNKGFRRTIDVTSMTIISFLRLIQNKISPKNIGGVISIGQAASESFKIGIHHFLQMMAILSVHLFILNLLPIPVLDGGHLLFYTIEALKGAPVSMRKMEIAQQVGLVLLMSLMAFALFNDFSRLLGFW